MCTWDLLRENREKSSRAQEHVVGKKIAHKWHNNYEIDIALKQVLRTF